MPNHRSFPNPFRFYFNHSRVLAPARNLYRQAEDWTDYAYAVGYLIFLFAMLLLGALTLPPAFIHALGAAAIVVILVRLVWQYLLAP